MLPGRVSSDDPWYRRRFKQASIASVGGRYDARAMNLAAFVATLRGDSRRLFAFDGIGALVSALALGALLAPFAGALGTTRSALLALASVPLAYALYDVACMLLRPRSWRLAVTAIACANLAYPLVSAAVLVCDGVALTPLGAAYFAVEAVVVAALAMFELHVARGVPP